MFPFNQPEKTKDCGYRCVYYALGLSVTEPFEKWIEGFKVFDPAHHGIYFSDIVQILKFNGRECKFTQLTEDGLYIVFSGCWLKHGHYFVYHNGHVFCSMEKGPLRMSLKQVIERMETKSSDHGFKVLKVFAAGEKNDIKQKPWEKSEQ